MRVVLLRWRRLAAGSLLVLLLHTLVRDRIVLTGPTLDSSCVYQYDAEEDLQRLLYYCNPLDQAALGLEGEVTLPIGTDNARLVSVHAVVRHGDRFHLNRLPDNTIKPFSCMVGEDLKRSLPVARGYEQVMKEGMENKVRRPHQTFHGWHLYPHKETCNLGQLTPQGAGQHLVNGKLFRQRYLDLHNLLTVNKTEGEILVKSSNYSRTFQSAMALMYGFLPEMDISNLNIEVVDNVTFCSKDSGLPCNCDAAKNYKDIFPARHRQLSAKLRLSSKAQDVYQHLAQVFSVGPEDLLPPSHNLDIFMVHLCHNRALSGPRGTCLQPWAFRDMYDLLAENGQRAVEDTVFKRAVRLKMQPLLHEIAERMVKQGNHQSPLKFVLYSGHDTTVEPLALALGFSSGIWARYASRIVFELYSLGTQTDLYIRVLYNGRVVTNLMPFCKTRAAAQNAELCPLRHFVKFVRVEYLKDFGENTNYADACTKEVKSDPL